MVPTKEQKLARQSRLDEERDIHDSTKTPSRESFELSAMYKAFEAEDGNRAPMKSAYTPRTTAFNRLEGRDLPLRHIQ